MFSKSSFLKSSYMVRISANLTKHLFFLFKLSKASLCCSHSYILKNRGILKTNKQTHKNQGPNFSLLHLTHSGLALMSPSGLVCKIKGVIMMELQCLLYGAHTAILWLSFFSSLPSCTSLTQSIHKRIKREVEKVDLKNILGCSPNALQSLNQNFQELRISVFALMMLKSHWCVIFSTSSSLLHLWHFTSNCPRGNPYLIFLFASTWVILCSMQTRTGCSNVSLA